MSDTTIIDRRSQRGRSQPNRQRLLKKIEKQVRDAMPDVIDRESIQDIGKDGRGVNIPIKGINEPTFHHDNGLGKRNRVLPGNDQYVPGDLIDKPSGGGGAPGQEASDNPEKGQDEFTISLSREEFLQFYFQDLELPFFEEKDAKSSIDIFKWEHAGHTKQGVPARLNVIRSLGNSMGRRIAIKKTFENRLRDLETELRRDKERLTEDDIVSLERRIAAVQKKLKWIPFLDDVDLRYNFFIKKPIPISSAVMFNLMDVSQSMGKQEKDIAKRFYFFLYLMLEMNYDEVQLVWIRHHTEATRVDEETFFNDRETGGTIVSTAIELADTLKKFGDDKNPGGFPTKNWNIYFAQASDGDNMYNDMDRCTDLLMEMMRYINYYAYIQIRSPGEYNLWKSYKENVAPYYPQRFQMRHVFQKKEIWQVFRELFEKKTV